MLDVLLLSGEGRSRKRSLVLIEVPLKDLAPP